MNRRKLRPAMPTSTKTAQAPAEVGVPGVTGLHDAEPDETGGKVLEAHPGKREKPPHHEGVEHPGYGPLPNHPCLEDDLRKHCPEPTGDPVEWEIPLLGGQHRCEPPSNSPCEVSGARQDRECQNDPFDHKVGSYRAAPEDRTERVRGVLPTRQAGPISTCDACWPPLKPTSPGSATSVAGTLAMRSRTA